MLIDYRRQLSSEERKRYDKIKDVLRTIDPEIRELMASHREKSIRWMPHEVVPWGKGEDFLGKPWHQDQSPLTPAIADALETHLLTEDNLPYYHAQIQNMTDDESSLREWSGLWT